jgi:CMP-N-acetylneuraminic acid synthetase
MSEEIVAFLPCRKGSQRVINKNVRAFAGVAGGLIQIKITQLLACNEIDRIVVSTDDELVMDIVAKHANRQQREVTIIQRPEHLATSQTSTDEIIHYVPNLIDSGIVLWTHVTSPFVGPVVYTKAIGSYREKVLQKREFDSLMSVTKMQNFIWSESGPVNYNPDIEKWPRTQTITPWYEVNSAIFMAEISCYKSSFNRIGARPFLFELEGPETIDIDWEKDFILAEKMAQSDGRLMGFQEPNAVIV